MRPCSPEDADVADERSFAADLIVAKLEDGFADISPYLSAPTTEELVARLSSLVSVLAAYAAWLTRHHTPTIFAGLDYPGSLETFMVEFTRRAVPEAVTHLEIPDNLDGFPEGLI